MPPLVPLALLLAAPPAAAPAEQPAAGPPPAPRLALEHLWSRVAEDRGEANVDQTADGLNTACESARFDPAGARIVSGSKLDNSIRVFDLEGNQLWKRYSDAEVERAQFTADGRFVLAGAEDGLVRVFDADDGEPVHALPHGAGIDAMNLHPSGDLLVVGTERRVIPARPDSERTADEIEDDPGLEGEDLGRGEGLNFWDVSADDPADWRHLRFVRPDTTARTDVNAIDFDRAGETLVAAWRDGAARSYRIGLTDRTDGGGVAVTVEPLREFRFEDEAPHGGSCKIARVGEPPAGSGLPRMIAAGIKGWIGPRIWNLDTGELIAELPDTSRTNDALEFTPDGRFLVVGGNEGRAFDNDFDTARYGDRGGVSRISVYPADGLVTFGDRVGPCAVVDGVFRQEYFDFTADGGLMVSAHEDCTVQLWRVARPGDR